MIACQTKAQWNKLCKAHVKVDSLDVEAITP